ncbi:protein N-terminal asparagine amidohydrolase isoform X2 [Iris pallida]|uniref:Protein N-terminal asparagine amidohydrolase isoform X2 n=1 Tax=Iris pallida TaxID=29817 RepID=A0AAX6H4M5_IRIPA|nr:protein N-terminal asparagine amidohydrolase isoform X2 [Iris pallida]
MIFVDGVPVTTSHGRRGEILSSLLENPTLLSALERFKSAPAMTLPGSEPVKHVYVFQKEYATVDPALVQFVGTDEATTCVGLVIRNRKTGMTSVSHMDSGGIVDMGLTQMLSLVVDREVDSALDVHLIGGYQDAYHDLVNGTHEPTRKPGGFSLPLCSNIIETMQNRQEKFHIRTLCILGHNTRYTSNGIPLPIISGFLVDTTSGLVIPASFNRRSRCPDEVVRRVRVSVSYEDPSWKGRLLETYDTRHDIFQIAPCTWSSEWGKIAFSLQQYSDSEILLECSTSPSAESPDFVKNERRVWSYLMNHPDWRQTFLGRKPRVFERTISGEWLQSE